MTPLLALTRRELALTLESGGPLLGVGLMTALTAVVPFSLGPSASGLASVAPAIVWIALILSTLLSLDRMFERDLESGALDTLAAGPLPLTVVVTVKALAQWLACGGPITLAGPVAALSLGAPARLAPIMLGVGTLAGLACAFIGSAGAALTAGSRRGGVLIAFIVLPLLTPVIIFGGAALLQVQAGERWTASVALLAAYALAAVVVTPLATAAACRAALD